MKSNREAIWTMDFLKVWFKAFKRTPMVMIKMSFIVVIALVAIVISNWLTKDRREIHGSEKRI